MFNLSESDIQQALIANGTPDGTNGAGIIGTQKRVVARFFMHATKDGDASMAAGRTIYREVPYVEVRADGAKDSVSHEVEVEDRKLFPQEWAQFEEQRRNPVHSVMALPGFTASAFRYCDDAEIYTIEALATANVQPELQALKAMAVRWLAMLHGSEPVAPKRGGRKPGSKNKPKVKADGIDAQNAA